MNVYEFEQSGNRSGSFIIKVVSEKRKRDMKVEDDYEIKLQKSIEIYADLIRQRDNAKSKTLYYLLNEEISNFVYLLNEFLNESLERIKQIEDKEIGRI